MKFNLSVRKKMMMFILGVTVMIYVVTLGIMSYQFRSNAIQEAKNQMTIYTSKKANEVKASMNEDLVVARVMANTLLQYKNKPREIREELQTALMTGVLEGHEAYEAVWLSWELEAIDPGWTKSYGRERITFFYKDTRVTQTVEQVDLNGDNKDGDYYRFKIDKEEEITEPYVSEDYELGVKNTKLITSPCVPILENGKFVGLVGTDYDLSKYQKLLDQSQYDSAGHAMLVSYNGNIVAHPDTAYVNEPLSKLEFTQSREFNFSEIMAGSGEFSWEGYDSYFDEDVFVSVLPINLVGAEKPWAIITTVPVSVATKDFNTTFILVLVIGFVGLAILAVILFKMSYGITHSIRAVSSQIRKLADGDIDESQKLEVSSNDEFGQITESVNTVINEIAKKTEFSGQIGSGNLDASYHPSSDKDELGQSLIKLRDNLKTAIDDTRNVVMMAGEQGRFDSVVKIDGKEGAWEALAVSVNNLLASIMVPMKEFNRLIEGMANGDLTLRFEVKTQGAIEQMANNFNQALSNLDGLMHQISNNLDVIDSSASEMKKASDEMSINTREIASAIVQMSNGAQSQVVKVDESSNLIEGILGSSVQMGEKAENINTAAGIGVDRSEKGLSMITNVVDSMGEISTYSAQTDESMKILTERASEITRVLGVITDIASQTNLLALNAAIEAAQAGDAGRGFAVVAEEIRKLAEDSRNSAREIETLINDVQNDTKEAAKVIEVMNSSVKSGEKTSMEASDAFKEIIDSSKETLNYSEEILNAARQQNDGINNVVGIIEEVVIIAEQTAAGTEEVAASSTDLSDGMDSYNLKIQKLAEVADSLKEGISMVSLSGEEEENTFLYQMKEAYEQEKPLLDAFLNFYPASVYFKDNKGKFIRTSLNFAKENGANSVTALAGKSDFDLYDKEHAAIAFEKEKEIMETRKPIINFIEVLEFENQPTKYIETTKLPLVNSNDEVVGIFGISKDVTESKSVEIQSEERLKLLETRELEMKEAIKDAERLKLQLQAYEKN